MNAIHVQAATSDQATSILAVLMAAFQQYRDVLDPPSGVFSETPDDIKHKLTAGGGFVASDGLEIVGMVLYQPHTEYMYLGRLAVLPDYRGRHIARNLIAAVEQEARKQNLYCVQLGVRLVLRDNQALFQRLGYTIKSYHAHEGYNDYTYATMEKRLPL